MGFTYIGGSTALLEFAGLRWLIDPSFDPEGAQLRSGAYVLERTAGPALQPAQLPPIDVVLLSHDHHFDNLDGTGRAFLPSAKKVLTTEAGADRLRGNAVGLAVWDSIEIGSVRVTATPARHGPKGGDRGPVVGFALEPLKQTTGAVYVSGDTVWFEGVAQVGERFDIQYGVLFMGAARVEGIGPQHLTLTAEEAVKLAQSMPKALILPLHFAGWKHFSESRADIEAAFASAGLAHRLRWGIPGERIEV